MRKEQPPMWTYVFATVMLFSTLFITTAMTDTKPVIVREYYKWLDKEEGQGSSTIMSFKVWIVNPDQDKISLTINLRNYYGTVFDSFVRVQYGDPSRELFTQSGDTTIFKYVKAVSKNTFGVTAVLNEPR